MHKYFDHVNDETVFAAAVFYHDGNLTQEEIKTRLGLSSGMQVSRLLRQAEEKGYVKRPILEAPLHMEMAAQLLKRLSKLRRVKVANTHESLPNKERVRAVASAAAQLWETEMQFMNPPVRIGIGGGRAIAALVDRVKLPSVFQMEFLSIANIPAGDWGVSADTNVAVLRRRFSDVNIRPLGALKLSPEMTSKDIDRERNRLRSLNVVKKHMLDFRECQLVFSGMGSVEDRYTAKLIESMNLPERIPQTVSGDISYNLVYHDKDVIHKNCPMHARLISVEMNTLREISSRERHFVAVVAWGALKAKPILDAYRAGLFNALVIEVELATELLKQIDNGYHELKI